MLKEMKNFLRHLFLPHYSNNQRAKLLHHESLFLLILFLIFGSMLLGFLHQNHPHVLGLSADISTQDLLLITNQKRQDAGISSLSLNSQLSQAAAAKATDMFAKNYWAHFAPNGKSPWDFIHEAGYQYTYAGENLARGFGTAQDTVNAWMASPDHRANMLSKNFTEVGFAVEQGNLTGDNGTILVVEMFGSQAKTQTVKPLPQVVENVQAAIPTIVPSPTPPPPPLATQSSQTISTHPLIASTTVRSLGIFLLGLFVGLFLLDLILTKRKKVVRVVGHNMDHILFFATLLIIAGMIGSGIIF